MTENVNFLQRSYRGATSLLGRTVEFSSALIKPLNQPPSPVYANAPAFAQINQHEPSLTLAVLTYLITIKENRRRGRNRLRSKLTNRGN